MEMTSIVIDEETLKKLDGISEPVRLCAQSGEVVGVFTPTTPSYDDYVGADPPIDEEEVKRRIAAGGGRPLMEILADLRAGQ